MAGFQTVVNRQPALGIEGDWYGSNPRSSLTAPEGGLVAGVGLSVGRFAWADPDGVVNYGGNGRIGFIQADQPSLIPFTPQAGFGGIAQATMLVAQGYEMNLASSGDVLIRFAAAATPGQKVYANFADGTAVALATASPSGATSTSYTIAAGTFSTTSSIAGGVLNVTVVGAGTLYPGSTISGTGVISGNQIIRQISGTTGGVGTYELAYDDGVVVASETITGTYGLATLAATITGTFKIGDTLSGTGVTAGTVIWADSSNGASLTGAGGAGTYVVSPTQTASTGTITAATNFETAWYVQTYAAAGELAICSHQI